MNVSSIVTKLGEPKYLVTLGLGFLVQEVIITAAPIRLNFTLHGEAEVSQDVTINATPIRLSFSLSGSVISGDIFILDIEARINLKPQIKAQVNKSLTFLTPVELEEEVFRVRIT